MNNQFESTYALLVRSEEKRRGMLEGVLYVAFILSAILLIWAFAQSPINIQAPGLTTGLLPNQRGHTQSRRVNRNEDPQRCERYSIRFPHVRKQPGSV